MKKIIALLSISVFAIIFNGCGGDKPAFTTAQDKAAAAYLGSELLGQATEVSVDETASATVACPDGGNVKVEVSSNDGESGEIKLDFQSCDFIDDTDGPCNSGKTITVDGDLTYTVSTSYSTYSYAASIAVDGTLNFSGGLDGSCAWDCTISYSSTSSASGITWTGTICGESAFTDEAAWEDDVCESLGATATASL